MNKMLLLFVLMASPLWAQPAACTPGSGTCITASEDKNVFLHATCDDDGALLISLEAPHGRLSGDDIQNSAGQDGGGWTCAGEALRGHCNILYARVSTPRLLTAFRHFHCPLLVINAVRFPPFLHH